MSKLEMSKKNEEEIIKILKSDAEALRWVSEQTEAMCLAAIESDVFALEYVKNQTENICLTAVKQNGEALQFVDPKFLKEDITDLDYKNPISCLKHDDIIILNGIKYKKIK